MSNTIEPLHLKRICQAFCLGTPQRELIRLHQGFTHTVWKLITQRHHYMIKKIHPSFAQGDYEENIQSSHRIQQIFAKSGIPSQELLLYANEPYLKIDNIIYLVSPWIEGHVKQGTLSSSQTQALARVLANIHTMNLPLLEAPKLPWQMPTIFNWHYFFNTIEQSQVENFLELYHYLPKLIHWQDCYKRAMQTLDPQRVVSHRDLHLGNIIWRNHHEPVLIDWEGAGIIHPHVDLINLAVNVSYGDDGTCDRIIFNEVIHTYSKIRGYRPHLDQTLVFASFATWLGWLYYMIKRMFNHPEQRKSAHHQAIACITMMDYLENNLAAWNGA
ncbi:MAG: aminoglycoside phosphotransferase family protein [Legionellales bacterium]|nr:aminoglycoside phosphotransferase family protein [Legionellales bacterium]